MAVEVHNAFQPLCAVVICTRDRPRHLDQCLAAVSRLVYPRFSVVVVDNVSQDGRVREVAARWNARYVLEPVAGLSRARNKGASVSDGDIVGYLDDDAIPEPDWLSGMVEAFRDPLVMAATGRVYPPANCIGPEPRPELIRRFEFGGPVAYAVDRQTPGWFELVNFSGLGLGTNMAFRRCAFEVWDGFDTRLGRGAPLEGAEEMFAFSSLVTKGHKVAYTPRAVVTHPCQVTAIELQARYLTNLRALLAYMMFLYYEAPQYREAVLACGRKFLKRGLVGLGSQDRWREDRLLGNARALLAGLSGPWLYFRSRWAGSG